MAGHGSMRPLDTASDPARSGLPGIQPGSPQAGVAGSIVGSLSQAFQTGLNGPAAMLGGGAEGAEGAEAAGGLAELAPLAAAL